MREWRELRLYFRALADVRRLRLVAILAASGEVGVKDLCLQLRASQPLVSWHLRVLTRCGLVATRRQGRQVFCSLNREAFSAYQARLAQLLDDRGAEPESISREDVGQFISTPPPVHAGL
ncbi:MAG TPA: metalloregulator ArsR/SmtB family transcription factor [Chloroflexota bacterium]|nr:metalloregulator ArsR/SmtB family transcription factor [Chloroflexota bacterium]